MLDKLYYVIMVPMVYAAFGVFLLGVAGRSIRIVLAPRQKTTLQTFPRKEPAWLHAIIDTVLFPAMRTIRPALWAVTLIFHGALVLLVIGHLELIRDIRVLQIVPHQVFLGAGLVGLALTLSLLFFLFSRFSFT